MMRSKLSLIATLLTLLAVCDGSEAGLVRFDNRALWTSAAAANGSIEFASFTGRTGDFNDGQTVTLPDFSLTGYGDYNNSGFGPANFLEGGRLHGGVDTTPLTGFVVSYASGISAFGFDFGGAAMGGVLHLAINGRTFGVSADVGFLGVVATMGETFNSVRFESGGFPGAGQAESFVADDFSWVNAGSAVPEPSTLVLASLGAAIFGIASAKRHSLMHRD